MLDQSSSIKFNVSDEDQQLRTPLQNNKSFIQNLQVKLYTSRFINRLLKRRKQFQQLTPFHYQIVEDNATKEQYQKSVQKPNNIWAKLNKSKIARLQRKLYRRVQNLQTTYICAILLRIWHSIPIINPNNYWKMLWDIFLAFVRFYLLIVIPLETVFNNKMLYTHLAGSFYLCIAFLAMDIVVNSMTSYYDKGHLVTDFGSVAINYAKTGLGYDIFCLATLLTVMIQELNEQNEYIPYTGQEQRTINSGRGYISLIGIILQLKNILRVFDRLQNIQDFSQSKALMIDLLKLVMLLFLVEHMFTCIWYYAGLMEIDGPNWLNTAKLETASYSDQYVASFYFSTVTMITVGYGDIVPQNKIERLVSIAFMFCSTLQLSYTISAIWAVYQKLNERHEEHIRKMRAINIYMNNMNISYDLRYKVREYLSFYWKEQVIEENMEVQDILTQLSPDLQESITFEAHSMIVQGCQLFRDYFTHEFKGECLKLVQSITLTPEKLLQVEQPALYFVERGEMLVHYPNKRLVLSTLRKGDNFGTKEFLLGLPFPLDYKSIGFSKLMYITRNDFMTLLSKYPQDLEQLCYLKDNVQYGRSNFANYCHSCTSMQHCINQCPLLNYKPDVDLLLKREAYPIQQPRRKYRRVQHKRRGILCKVAKKEQDEQTVPSCQSEESLELDLQESWHHGHNQYFKDDGTNQKRKKKVSIKKREQTPIEIQEVGDYSDNDLNSHDQQELETLRIKLNHRTHLNIDTIKEYEIYYPDHNSSYFLKNQKVNNKWESQWKSVYKYLTHPNEFLKKFRKNQIKVEQVIAPVLRVDKSKRQTVLIQRISK